MSREESPGQIIAALSIRVAMIEAERDAALAKVATVWDVINDYRGTRSKVARRLRREVRAALRGELP